MKFSMILTFAAFYAADAGADVGGSSAVSEDVPAIVHAVEDGARATARHGKAFMIGPEYVVPTYGESLSCEQLYAEIVRTTSDTYSYRQAFFDDPRNGAILAAGFVDTVFLYGLAYTSWSGYTDTQRLHKAQQQLDGLRQASARKRCWVRD